MALYLGSNEIDVIYNIVASNELDVYINGTLSKITAEQIDGAKKLRNYAFYNQKSLTNVTLPATIESIGDYAFSGCSKISYVRFLSTTPPTIGRNALPTGGGMRWYVPAGYLEVYQNAPGFSDYISYLKEW